MPINTAILQVHIEVFGFLTNPITRVALKFDALQLERKWQVFMGAQYLCARGIYRRAVFICARYLHVRAVCIGARYL